MMKTITNQKGYIAISQDEFEQIKKKAYDEGYAAAKKETEKNISDEISVKKSVNRAKIKTSVKENTEFRGNVFEKESL